MKLLLDTHTFIWWVIEPTKISAQALGLLQDQSNDLFLSVVSVWEMQIKLQIGKLKFNLPLAQLITEQQQTNQLSILPVTLEHVLALDSLPFHHKDPFDRLLITQANLEGAVLVSNDAIFSNYSVKLAW